MQTWTQCQVQWKATPARGEIPVDVDQHSVESPRGIQVALQHEVGEAGIVVQCNVGARNLWRQQIGCLERIDRSQGS